MLSATVITMRRSQPANVAGSCKVPEPPERPQIRLLHRILRAAESRSTLSATAYAIVCVAWTSRP